MATGRDRTEQSATDEGRDTSTQPDDQSVWLWDDHTDQDFIDNLPTASDAVAEALIELPAAWGEDQATMAARLRWLGIDTKPQTVRRIEVGAQPPTLEQALALALMHPGGLRALLARGQFRVGTTPLIDGDDIEGLLAGT